MADSLSTQPSDSTQVIPATASPAATPVATPLWNKYVQTPTLGYTPLTDLYARGSDYSQPRTPLYNRYLGPRGVDTAEAITQRPATPIALFPHSTSGPFDAIVFG